MIGKLLLDDTVDFLAPSLVCTKEPNTETKSDTKRKIQFDTSNAKTEVPKVKKVEKLKKVKPSLVDCLSCSGCLTSSEEVLLAEQNTELISDVISRNIAFEKNRQKILAVSISPQSKASLAVANNLSYEDTSKKLILFFRKMGFSIILDTTVGREISLLESGKEFVKHFRENKAIPLITSACPGWVTYMEKQSTKESIKHLSLVKSPMQITACIAKNYLASKMGVTNPAQVFHLSIQPCFDRKLEAARSDFYDKELDYKYVDCAITSGELHEWINKEGVSLADLNEETPNTNYELLQYNDIWRHESSGSDGYLDYVLRYAAKELFDKDLGSLDYKIIRHIDMQEVAVYDDVAGKCNTLDKDGSINNSTSSTAEDRKPLLKFAFAYGYRMIQAVSNNLKRNKLPYNYMEVMGCPSGCLNGLGQVDPKSFIKVKDEYDAVNKRVVGSHPIIDQLYKDWLEQLSEKEFHKTTRTSFKCVPPSMISF